MSRQGVRFACGAAAISATFFLANATTLRAQTAASLPDAPSSLLGRPEPISATRDLTATTVANLEFPSGELFSSSTDGQQQGQTPAQPDAKAKAQAEAARRRRFDITSGTGEVDANGNPIGHANEQPKRILGFIPNFRSVSMGARPAPPGWHTNFKTATRQAFDPSAFLFLFLTSASAYGLDSHPSLTTYNGGDAVFWAYLWRGFVDKTDGTYLGSFLLPSLLHEDTRYYAMGPGPGHSVTKRTLYAASRVIIARNYEMHNTPNLAGIGGKIGAQAVSRLYYPAGSEGFSVLATKFTYACLRDAGFTVLREFSPDIDRYFAYRHRRKLERQAAAKGETVQE